MQGEEPESPDEPCTKKEDGSRAEPIEQTPAQPETKPQPDKYNKLKLRFEALKKVGAKSTKKDGGNMFIIHSASHLKHLGVFL